MGPPAAAKAAAAAACHLFCLLFSSQVLPVVIQSRSKVGSIVAFPARSSSSSSSNNGQHRVNMAATTTPNITSTQGA
jgi:hypothetical protein